MWHSDGRARLALHFLQGGWRRGGGALRRLPGPRRGVQGGGVRLPPRADRARATDACPSPSWTSMPSVSPAPTACCLTSPSGLAPPSATAGGSVQTLRPALRRTSKLAILPPAAFAFGALRWSCSGDTGPGSRPCFLSSLIARGCMPLHRAVRLPAFYAFGAFACPLWQRAWSAGRPRLHRRRPRGRGGTASMPAPRMGEHGHLHRGHRLVFCDPHQ